MVEAYNQYLPGAESLVGRAAERARRRMFAIFMREMAPDRDATILDVGVTDSDSYALDNCLEALYPWKDRITAAGLEDASHLEQRYPGLRFVRITPGPLPFADQSFDFVHSSAVIEHVGSRQNQAAFLAELWRVARRGVFLTTPNRWFPIEVHTVMPLIHWLPPKLFRAALRVCGKDYYAREETLNLLSTADLYALAAQRGLTKPAVLSVSMLGWPTNLIFTARR